MSEKPELHDDNVHLDALGSLVLKLKDQGLEVRIEGNGPEHPRTFRVLTHKKGVKRTW